MSTESDSLLAILADMLCSALTWEEKNAPSSSQTDRCDPDDVYDDSTPITNRKQDKPGNKKGCKDNGNPEELRKAPE